MPSRKCLVCSRPARPGASRCKRHGGKAWVHTKPRDRQRYGYAWQQLRARVLKEEPTCQMCGQRPSTDVDHITAAADGGTEDRANLRGLCNPCHKKHTQAQNRRRKQRRATT